MVRVPLVFPEVQVSRLIYRRAQPPDRRFIVESWLDSYKDSHTAGLIPMESWYSTMRPIIQDILDRPGVTAHVAAWAGESSGAADLAGWCAVERGFLVQVRARRFRRYVKRLVVCQEPLVLYVLVKQPYRRTGIARALFAAAGVDPEQPFRYACRTGVLSKLKAKVPHATWEPMVVRYPPRRTDGISPSVN